MGVGQTGRIISVKRMIDQQVRDYERKKYAKSHNGRKFTKFLIHVLDCTQCGRKMDKRIGDIQIENKRENAPICIPCIIGIPRRPLKEVMKDKLKFKKETRKILNKVIKKYKHL